MTNFNTVKDAVRTVLTTEPATRDSDWLLISKVMEFFVDTNVSLADLCKRGYEQGDIPSFESIRRYRQKWQEMIPELRSTKKIQEYRKEQEIRIRKELGYES